VRASNHRRDNRSELLHVFAATGSWSRTELGIITRYILDRPPIAWSTKSKNVVTSIHRKRSRRLVNTPPAAGQNTWSPISLFFKYIFFFFYDSSGPTHRKTLGPIHDAEVDGTLRSARTASGKLS